MPFMQPLGIDAATTCRRGAARWINDGGGGKAGSDESVEALICHMTHKDKHLQVATGARHSDTSSASILRRNGILNYFSPPFFCGGFLGPFLSIKPTEAEDGMKKNKRDTDLLHLALLDTPSPLALTSSNTGPERCTDGDDQLSIA